VSSNEVFLEMLLFASVVGVFTVGGYNYAVLHVSPLVFSMAKLIDSFLTGVASWSVGLEGVPPPMGTCM
jgi:hypothetical protein